MELYSFLYLGGTNYEKFIKVSVSLWSYIHSYYPVSLSMTSSPTTSFRLLMELYSFLLAITAAVLKLSKEGEFPSPYGVIFILIFMLIMNGMEKMFGEFPSPYGVIFILILTHCMVGLLCV